MYLYKEPNKMNGKLSWSGLGGTGLEDESCGTFYFSWFLSEGWFNQTAQYFMT